MFNRLWKSARKALAERSPSARGRLECEALETRQMLSTTGVDYALSGFSWSNPSKITYSLPADGVSWDQGYNNLNASLNANFGNANWKRDFARSLQTWAASANINVVAVADNNAPFNVPGLSQGDPNFGDIRLGGFDFQDNQTLAQTYFPPPNGVTASGDVEVNTAFNWGPNGPYDYFSVMLHEVGHSFGLKDLPNSPSVEAIRYAGVRPGLMPGDIAGIQAIYGPRTPDAFQSAGRGISASGAIDVTAQLAGSGAATISNISLATIGDTEYFQFVAPAGSNEGLRATAVASGISSLSPKITVYDASMNALGTAADPNSWGNSPTVSLGNIQPGQTYIVAVTGATSDVFAVGAYALSLAVSGTNAQPSPIVTPPPIIVTPPVITSPAPTPPPNPAGPSHSSNRSVALGFVNQTVLTGQNLYSATDRNLFAFQAARSGTMVVAATGPTLIRVINQRGQVVASGVGAVSVQVPKAGTFYYVLTTSSNGSSILGYNLAIVTQPAQPARRVRAARSHQDVPAADTLIHPTTAAPVDRPVWKTPHRVLVVNDRLRTPLAR